MNKNSISATKAASTAVSSAVKKPSGVYSAVKRLLDMIFAFLCLLLGGIPMLIIMLAIRLDTHSSPIFRQKRVGRNGKQFYCYKFRTMTKEAPRYCAKKDLENADAFITRTGKILRLTSLDELPQVWNILLGDMSFIGPRPLIPEETTVHALRTEYGVYQLRPGISGYAQIHGRDMISDERKAALDKYYLDHFSFHTDVKILCGTVLNVLCEKDIHQGTVDYNDLEE